jgi:hypothetical protein
MFARRISEADVEIAIDRGTIIRKRGENPALQGGFSGANAVKQSALSIEKILAHGTNLWYNTHHKISSFNA